VINCLIRFKAFHKITSLFSEVSFRSDINGEYFLMNYFLVSSLRFFDNFISFVMIAITDPIVAIITTIEK
jgi:hypothetical protein